MELRRPKLEDKEKILEMLADFEAVGSRQDGFFGETDFVYEDWLYEQEIYHSSHGNQFCPQYERSERESDG